MITNLIFSFINIYILEVYINMSGFFASALNKSIIFFANILCRNEKYTLFLHSQTGAIELWCNGNTTVSGSVFPGSSPGSSTSSQGRFQKPAFLFSGYFPIVRINFHFSVGFTYLCPTNNKYRILTHAGFHSRRKKELWHFTKRKKSHS